MKTRYQITGTTRLNNLVRLFLDRQDLVKEQEPGIMSALADMEGMQLKMQQKAVLMQQPDVISIPFEEWKKKQYKIGDYIWIDITDE